MADAIDKLVQVAAFFDLAEAHILKGLLESEGLEVFLFDEQAAAFAPLVVGGVRLMVREPDLERARELLKTEQQ